MGQHQSAHRLSKMPTPAHQATPRKPCLICVNTPLARYLRDPPG